MEIPPLPPERLNPMLQTPSPAYSSGMAGHGTTGENVSVTLATQLGLRQDLLIKALVIEVQHPTGLSIPQWTALIELNNTIETFTSSIPPSQAILQVISALPLQRGQQLSLMLDRNNRLQIMNTHLTSPAEDLSIMATRRSALIQALTRSPLESSTPTGNLLQKLTKTFTPDASEAVNPLFKNIPSLEKPTMLKHSIEHWVSSNAALHKKTLAAQNEAVDETIDSPLIRFVKNILQWPNVSYQNNLQPHLAQDSAIQQLVLYLKRILLHEKNSLVNASSNPAPADQALKLDENRLSALLQALVTRISALHSENQLSHVDLGDTAQSFKLDIPLWMHDPLQNDTIQNVLLTIEKEKYQDKNKKNKAQDRRWKIFMEFDLGRSGRLEAEALIREHHVNVSLWAEEKHTRHSINEKLSAFNERLIKKGIPVESIHCRQDHFKKPSLKRGHPFSLINIKG